MSPARPTRTTSDMRAPLMDRAITVGPETLLMIPLMPPRVSPTFYLTA